MRIVIVLLLVSLLLFGCIFSTGEAPKQVFNAVDSDFPPSPPALNEVADGIINPSNQTT
ncbi:MAG: hypothetical protein ABH803_00420 [Candidatus Micrarchaeota archaeon]